MALVSEGQHVMLVATEQDELRVARARAENDDPLGGQEGVNHDADALAGAPRRGQDRPAVDPAALAADRGRPFGER
eukprot:12446413-Alexandrium_andersonii.AAC.1